MDYFQERSKNDSQPRTIIDILAYSMVVVIFLLIWIMYAVWNTDPRVSAAVPLTFLAGEVEEAGEKIAEAITKKRLISEEVIDSALGAAIAV